MMALGRPLSLGSGAAGGGRWASRERWLPPAWGWGGLQGEALLGGVMTDRSSPATPPPSRAAPSSPQGFPAPSQAVSPLQPSPPACLPAPPGEESPPPSAGKPPPARASSCPGPLGRDKLCRGGHPSLDLACQRAEGLLREGGCLLLPGCISAQPIPRPPARPTRPEEALLSEREPPAGSLPSAGRPWEPCLAWGWSGGTGRALPRRSPHAGLAGGSPPKSPAAWLAAGLSRPGWAAHSAPRPSAARAQRGVPTANPASQPPPRSRLLPPPP